MKILLDHCVPKRLRRVFPLHEVKTTREMDWGGLSNGKLLAEAAQSGFDVMLTVDQNIQHQQNLDTLPIAVVVLIAANNRFVTLAPMAEKLEAALQTLSPKTLIEISRTFVSLVGGDDDGKVLSSVRPAIWRHSAAVLPE